MGTNMEHKPEHEKEISDLWLQQTEGELDEDFLIHLASVGFEDCGTGYCPSRENATDGMCRCIRETFPTLNHFLLYQEMRRVYENWITQALIASAIDKKEKKQ